MAYVPRFKTLFKVLFHVRDSAEAEGLFLEGSIEYENGNLEDARKMFLFGSRLDPHLAGNHYNLAIVTEKLQGASEKTIKAWEDYLEAAPHDPRQNVATREKVRKHIAELKTKAGRTE
mgnify:CR=1 FL=1